MSKLVITAIGPASSVQDGGRYGAQRFGLTPSYRVIEEAGPDHDKIFTIGVYVGDTLYGKGSGSSKQAGQQEAAAGALEKLAAAKPQS